jgi:hypothetical protein
VEALGYHDSQHDARLENARKGNDENAGENRKHKNLASILSQNQGGGFKSVLGNLFIRVKYNHYHLYFVIPVRLGGAGIHKFHNTSALWIPDQVGNDTLKLIKSRPDFFGAASSLRY